MNKKQPVSFNIMTDMKISDVRLQILQDSIESTFKKYFPSVECKLPNSINMVSPIKLSPLGILNYLKIKNYKKPIKHNSFFKQYFFIKYMFTDFLEHDVNIMVTKHHTNDTWQLGSNSIFTDSKSAKFMIIINLTSNHSKNNYSFQDNIFHEILHCHPMFRFNNLFHNNHCIYEHCVMHEHRLYELNEPYCLCDSCMEKIKTFYIPKEILAKNIKNSLFYNDDANINSVLNLYNKIYYHR
jgi:hypothetical protein